jgi:hypothetical protein
MGDSPLVRPLGLLVREMIAFLRHRDPEFESRLLQRGVQCEPDFGGKSVERGQFARRDGTSPLRLELNASTARSTSRC